MSFIDPSVGDGQNTINGIIDNGSTYGIGISDDLNITGLSTFTDTVRFTSTVRLDGQLRDGDNAFGTSGQVLSSDGTDTRWINAASLSAGAASQVAINADNTTNASRFITFVNSSSGNNTLKTDTGLTYNPSTNTISASSFSGNLTGTIQTAAQTNITSVGTLTGLTVNGNITQSGTSNYIRINGGLQDKDGQDGNSGQVLSSTGTQVNWINVGDISAGSASQIAVSDESSDTNTFLVFTSGATGNQSPKSGSNLTFNSSTGALSATSFVGDLTGDVTGNAATATKWASGINFDIIGEVTGAAVSFDGSSNLTFDADIANNVVDEANLKVSNSPTNGYFLQAQSGNTGGLTWAEVDTSASGLSGSTLASGITASSITSLGALTSLDCNGTADFDGGQVNIRYDHASTPALYVRNNTTYNQIIARFVGNSASLDIENISTGDYFFGHPTQHNGFQFFDTTGGVDIVYNNTVSVEFDSGNNFGDFKGTPSVNGTNIDHFASGTKMIFQQTSAPTGWTKITSNTNQRALRVVSGTAGSGGSHNFTTVFTSSRATSGASVSSHTLTTSQIPSHTHDTPNHTHTVDFDIGNTDLDHTHDAGSYNTDSQGNHNHEITDSSSQDSGDGFAGYQGVSGGSGSNSVNSSSNGDHTHDITGASGSALGNHNHDVHNIDVTNASPTTHSEGGGSGHSHGFTDATVDLAVYYLDVIIAQKD